MPEQAFEVLYDEIRKGIPVYTDPGERIAYITGYLRGIDPDTSITVGEVSQILALRYPEEEKSTCIGWGATGA
ncbi:MAG TPA: hypothetical protein H9776_04505 [Candidatus Mediterraneibacter intestinipullorum]|nr:hypothetical protein [Candidatus Mediterraneibacter intestinipullorum]